MSRLVEINVAEISDISCCSICRKSSTETLIFLRQCKKCKSPVMSCDDCYDIMTSREKMYNIDSGLKCTSCLRNDKINQIII